MTDKQQYLLPQFNITPSSYMNLKKKMLMGRIVATALIW